MKKTKEEKLREKLDELLAELDHLLDMDGQKLLNDVMELVHEIALLENA